MLHHIVACEFDVVERWAAFLELRLGPRPTAVPTQLKRIWIELAAAATAPLLLRWGTTLKGVDEGARAGDVGLNEPG